jgi:hypothetical protein
LNGWIAFICVGRSAAFNHAFRTRERSVVLVETVVYSWPNSSQFNGAKGNVAGEGDNSTKAERQGDLPSKYG